MRKIKSLVILDMKEKERHQRKRNIEMKAMKRKRKINQ